MLPGGSRGGQSFCFLLPKVRAVAGMANQKAARRRREFVVVRRSFLHKELSFNIIEECRGVRRRNKDEVARAMHRGVKGIAGPTAVARFQTFAGLADSENLATGVSLNVEPSD